MSEHRTSNPLCVRLRARLITVPKPGTKPWKTTYPVTLHSSVGGVHKAGDDAGVQQVAPFNWSPNVTELMLQEHIYAVEPLCGEAADEIERLRAALKKSRAELIKGTIGNTHWEGCESAHWTCRQGKILDEALAGAADETDDERSEPSQAR